MTKFEFAQFPDFTQTVAFDMMMRDFQTTQAHHEEAIKAFNKAKQAYLQWQEYMNLSEDYRNMYSAMMKKLLDAKTATDIDKIRSTYHNKLIPILQKLNLIQAKITGESTPEQIESRTDIGTKFERVKELLAEATKLKQEVNNPASIAF
jgi:hypothetical protein